MKSTITITVIIHTKNAAKTLERALRSVEQFADEVIVADMHSEDKTVEIAMEHGAAVIHVKPAQYADPERNAVIKNAAGTWILTLDADEEIPQTLATALRSQAGRASSDQNPVCGIYIPRKNMIFGQWARTGWWPDYILRFFMRDRTTWPPHIHSQPVVEGRTAYLPAEDKYAILHHHYETVEQFVDRMNRYTSNEAAQQSIGDDFSFVHPAVHEVLRRYYAWGGNEQGDYGLALSLLQACSFCISAIKTWEKCGFEENNQHEKLEEDLDEAFRKLCYWTADHHVRMERSFLKRVFWKIRRKLMV